MKTAVISAGWEVIEGENRPTILSIWEPLIAADPALSFVNLTDTGQANVIPDPNACVFVVESVSEALLDALDGNPDIFIISEETL